MFILTSEKIILCVKRIYINIRKIAIFFLKNKHMKNCS